jgi:hypothetical protein
MVTIRGDGARACKVVANDLRQRQTRLWFRRCCTDRRGRSRGSCKGRCKRPCDVRARPSQERDQGRHDIASAPDRACARICFPGPSARVESGGGSGATEQPRRGPVRTVEDISARTEGGGGAHTFRERVRPIASPAAELGQYAGRSRRRATSCGRGRLSDRARPSAPSFLAHRPDGRGARCAACPGGWSTRTRLSSAGRVSSRLPGAVRCGGGPAEAGGKRAQAGARAYPRFGSRTDRPESHAPPGACRDHHGSHV